MRILILQLKRIGDVILTTPLIAPLRERFPSVDITLAVDANASALAPAIDANDVLVFERGWRGWPFWRRIAVRPWDVCLDLTGNDRSALASAISRATQRLTHKRFEKKFLRPSIYTDFVDSSVRDRHTVDHHTDLLHPLGIEIEGAIPAITLPADAITEARDAFAEVGVTGPFVVIHPGSARAEKFWLPDRWAAVIRHLQLAHGLPAIFTGSNDAAERGHIAAIQHALPQPCADLSGKLSLLGSAAVLAQGRVVCAVDSAPVHLADALRIPVVALFGPTNPYHWRPRNTDSRVVTPSESSEFRPKSASQPTSAITIEAVTSAVDDLLTT